MYFIRDCNDQIVGNPKGYRTFRGANQQANSRFSKINRELWNRLYDKRKAEPTAVMVCRVCIQEEV
jgi:hypothetical protein